MTNSLKRIGKKLHLHEAATNLANTLKPRLNLHTGTQSKSLEAKSNLHKPLISSKSDAKNNKIVFPIIAGI